MRTFCSILAGGIGKRMGGDTPKQFLPLAGTPIIIRTLQRVVQFGKFDAIVVAIHPDWEAELCSLMKSNSLDASRIILCPGGKERHDSIMNTLIAIKRNYEVSESDVVVVHDAVRPFVSDAVLEASIEGAAQYGASVATLPAVDTMLKVQDGLVVNVPPRAELFNGQAPDSARLLLLERAINSLTEDERKIITGTAQICVVKGIPVKAVPGDPNNIKITTPHDLEVAARILESLEGK